MAKKQERKRKHFIAVLGTGGYTPCTYCWEEGSCDTKFVQEAILKLACGELKSGDRITIFLTGEACTQNWKDRPYSQDEIEKKIGAEGGIRQGLCTVLQALSEDIPGITVEEKEIATGRDRREMAQMFLEINSVIEDDEEIYFDVTHGLRNIPMLVMTILEYARATKNISVGGIFYGAFEAGTVDKVSKKKMVPIYDLSFYHTILSWSNAANSFIRYGHADEINDLAKEKWQLIARTASKKQSRNLKELSGNLNNVAKQLQNFTASIETGRGDTAFKDGILNCYRAYAEEQALATEHLVEEYYPLKELLDKIDSKMERFKNAETNFQTGMAAVDWCIENRMVQQGYTALEETIKTFWCEKLGVPQDREFWRETVVKRLCSSLYDVIEGEPGILAGRLEEWKKQLRAHGGCDGETLSKALETGEILFGLITENTEHKKLVKLMDRLGTKRNDISHFGFTNQKATADNFKTELENMVNEFKNIQSEWD